MVKLPEIAAIQAAKDGDPKPLADLVRQGIELSPQARDIAARLIEGKSAKKRGEKRIGFYEEWRRAERIVDAVATLRDEQNLPLRSSATTEGAFLIVARQYFGRDNAERTVESIWQRWSRRLRR